nr:hypothetical protein [Glycomyces sp. L485]
MPEAFCDSIIETLPLPHAEVLTYEVYQEDGDAGRLDPVLGYECRISPVSSGYSDMSTLGGTAHLKLNFKRAEEDVTGNDYDWQTLEVPPAELSVSDWAGFITDHEASEATFTCRASFNEGCEDGAEIGAEGEEFVLEGSYVNLYLYADVNLWGDAADDDAEALASEIFGSVFGRFAEEVERG